MQLSLYIAVDGLPLEPSDPSVFTTKLARLKTLD